MWAVEARQTDEWSRATHLMATILNVNLPKGHKPVMPTDLMPQRKRPKQQPLTTDISALKMFLPKGRP